jgi:opacity protein-like surface antigen
LFIASTHNFAQFYIGPHVGFKASGLKGALKQTENGQVITGSVADAGKTGFNVGIAVGYQILPPTVLDGWYKLDLNVDVSYSSFGYLEEGFNSVVGSGKFSASGLDGGTTTVFSIDLMPIHRLSFPNFKLLSPYAGLGLGLNIMSTSDIEVNPPSQRGTVTGKGDFKLGLLIFYGVVFQISDNIKPFFQFKHLVPFGSETEFTSTYQSAQGGGSFNEIFSIQDVPGYFNLTAGVRFSF